jgi:hypothetical protein
MKIRRLSFVSALNPPLPSAGQDSGRDALGNKAWGSSVPSSGADLL